MSLVDDAVATPAPQSTRDAHAASARPAGAGPVPCAARPNTLLVHLDGRCECFFGGAPPVYLAARGASTWPPPA